METCRPGSCPAEDRPGAPCHENADLMQESAYSGYSKRHGLKILTVTLPNGLIGALYGAISAIENDNGTLNLSNLNVDMMRLQPEVTQARQHGEDILYYSLYGDAIFHCSTASPAATDNLLQGDLNVREEAENASMRQIRMSAEWLYETATNLFHILESKYNKHLLGHNREPNLVVGQQLRVLILIDNIYVCLNGSKFSRFFNIIPLTLEESLRVED